MKAIRMMLAGFVILFALNAAMAAQEKVNVPVKAELGVPVKILVVLTETDGDKKVSSLPYTLAVTANEGRDASIRMGSMIPVPTGPGSYNLQNVGTNIDCRVSSLDDTRYKVEVSISDTSVMERRSADVVPTLRNFVTNNSVVLRDGQSAQFTAAADKNTGEVVRVDVTLTLDKEK